MAIFWAFENRSHLLSKNVSRNGYLWSISKLDLICLKDSHYAIHFLIPFAKVDPKNVSRNGYLWIIWAKWIQKMYRVMAIFGSFAKVDPKNVSRNGYLWSIWGSLCTCSHSGCTWSDSVFAVLLETFLKMKNCKNDHDNKSICMKNVQKRFCILLLHFAFAKSFWS